MYDRTLCSLTLEATVTMCIWNQQHNTLTTADDTGVLIVWVRYQGKWCEEMVNNKTSSPVYDFQWNKSGSKICILYEDGTLMVGTVEGKRSWGKKLKTLMSKMQWSPDGKLLFMATTNGEIHIYDNNGNFMVYNNLAFLTNSHRPALHKSERKS